LLSILDRQRRVNRSGYSGCSRGGRVSSDLPGPVAPSATVARTSWASPRGCSPARAWRRRPSARSPGCPRTGRCGRAGPGGPSETYARVALPPSRAVRRRGGPGRDPCRGHRVRAVPADHGPAGWARRWSTSPSRTRPRHSAAGEAPSPSTCPSRRGHQVAGHCRV